MGPAHSTLVVGTTLGGAWTLVERLNEHHRTSTWRARSTFSPRQAALTTLASDVPCPPDVLEAWLTEGRRLADLSMAGVVPVLDAGREGALQWVVADYVDGLSLRLLLALEGPLSAGAASAIIGPVLEALAATHGRGIVHGAVRSSRVLLSSRPHPAVHLTGFGAWRVEPGRQGDSATAPTMRDDLRQVGALLAELLAGPASRSNAAPAEPPPPDLVPAPPVPPPARVVRLVTALRGPDPLPWPDAQAVREELFAAAPPEASLVWRPGVTFAALSPREALRRRFAATPGVLYAQTLKTFLDRVVFRRSAQAPAFRAGLSSPEFRTGLKALGVDLLHPRDLDLGTWVALLDLTAEALASDRPRPEGLFAVGQEMVRGLADGFVGNAVLIGMRLLGPRHLMLQVGGGFAQTDSIMKPVTREVSPTRVDIDFVTVGGVPTYLEGVMTEAARHIGARGFRVRWVERPDGSASFSTSWDD